MAVSTANRGYRIPDRRKLGQIADEQRHFALRRQFAQQPRAKDVDAHARQRQVGAQHVGVLRAGPDAQARGPVGLRRQPLARDLLPAFPAQRRIERREVEADGMRIGRNGGRAPLPALKHSGLVVLGDGLLAALAMIGRRFRLALGPAQALKTQPLHRAAMRAGHEIAPLVRCLELPLDPA